MTLGWGEGGGGGGGGIQQRILMCIARYSFTPLGCTCHMAVHVTWLYMSHGCTCHMAVHVTWLYMSQ